MKEKIRLDVALFERGFVDSREKGKALIMAVFLWGTQRDGIFAVSGWQT